jgi:hypothetical protein
MIAPFAAEIFEGDCREALSSEIAGVPLLIE